MKHLIYGIKSEIAELSNNIAAYDKVKDDYQVGWDSMECIWDIRRINR